MPLILLLIFPLAEIYAFTVFVQKTSFLEGLATLIISGFLGVFVMKLQGKAVIADFQSSISKGQLPSSNVLHRTLFIIGGFLLAVPGLISDFMGLLLILPGTRHLIVWYIQFMFARGLWKLSSKIKFNFGGFNTNGAQFGAFGAEAFRKAQEYQRQRNTHHQQKDFSSESSEKEARVIDITPLEITHTDIKKNDDPSS